MNHNEVLEWAIILSKYKMKGLKMNYKKHYVKAIAQFHRHPIVSLNVVNYVPSGTIAILMKLG